VRKQRAFIILLALSMLFAFFFENSAVILSKDSVGGYHYSDMFHFYLLHTPLFVILSWSLIISSTYFYLKTTRIPERLIPIFTGLLALKFDLSMDIFAIRFRFWFWKGYSFSDGFFGIPGNNYLGWLLVSWIFVLVYQRIRWKILAPIIAFALYTCVMTLIILPVQNVLGIGYMSELIFDLVLIVSVILIRLIVYRKHWHKPYLSSDMIPFIINRIAFLFFSVFSLFVFYKSVFLLVVGIMILIEAVIHISLHRCRAFTSSQLYLYLPLPSLQKFSHYHQHPLSPLQLLPPI